MGKRVSHIGEQFNGQIIIDQKYKRINGKYKTYVLVKCHCGNKRWMFLTATVFLSHSCGCLRSQLVSKSKIKHGGCIGKRERLYTIWTLMLRRCYNSKYKEYVNYGGRGITICTDWRFSFSNFREWALNNGYTDKLSIDRIDVNGNYNPSNCRWATATRQCRNKRNTIYLTIDGVTKPMQDWCEEYGVVPSMVEARLKMGWDHKEALLCEKNGRYKVNPTLNMVSYRGECRSLREWCEILKLDYARIYKRYYRGWDAIKMFETPIVRRKCVK